MSDCYSGGLLAQAVIAGMASGLAEISTAKPDSRTEAAQQVADELGKAVLSAEARSLAPDSTAKVNTSSSSFLYMCHDYFYYVILEVLE